MSSIGAISANDDVTDSYTTNSVDDTQDVSVSTSSVAESSQDAESDDGNAKSNVDDTSKVSLSNEKSLESDSNSLSTDKITNTDNSGENTQYAIDNTIPYAAGDSAQDTSSTTINSQDKSKYYKGSTPYTATFLNSQGQALADKDVNIIVNGQTYTVKTDGNGMASLDINLKPGSYKVTAQDPTTGYSVTNTFTILNTITANNVVKIYKDSKKFYATFLKVMVTL